MIGHIRALLSDIRGTDSSAPKGRPTIWAVAHLPPPLNGQSNMNAVMIDHFRRHALTLVLPLGASSGEKIASALLIPLIVLFRVHRRHLVYLSPPGQNGIWLTMPTLMMLRLKGVVHYVHHHSFRAINLGPLLPFRLLTQIGGRLQRNVLLSEGMLRRFAGLYLTKAQEQAAFVLPNVFFFYKQGDQRPRNQDPTTFGHMSVITAEKGILYFMTLMEAAIATDSDICVKIAGPIADPALQAEVLAFAARQPERVSYLGPLSGAAKDAFFRDIDVFVLPSRLIDEADPLVITEAYSAGCEVLASATGCIPERLRVADSTLSLDLDEDLPRVRRILAHLQQDRAAASGLCTDHVRALHGRSISLARAFFLSLGIAET